MGLREEQLRSNPVGAAEAPIYAEQHSYRSDLVGFLGSHAKEKSTFLKALAAIAERDTDTRSRLLAVEALGVAQWRPRAKAEASFVVQALAKAASADPNPIVRKQAGESLALLHSKGHVHENDPAIAQAVFPPDPQSSDFVLKNRAQALLRLGVEKPHVAKALEQNIDSVVHFLTPEMRSQPFYSPGRERVGLLLEQLRQGAKRLGDESQEGLVGVYSHWDPILAKLAAHHDPEIQMDAIATQIRLASDSLTAVLENEAPFSEYPKIKENTLNTQLNRLAKKLGSLVEEATGETQLAGIRLMGELVPNQPAFADELVRIGKLRGNRNNTALQLAVSAELVRNLEMRGNEIPPLIEAIATKAKGHEHFQQAISQAATLSPSIRNLLLDLHKQKSKHPQVVNLLEEILTDPNLVANLGASDDRTVNFYLKLAENETKAAKLRDVLLRVPMENLSKGSRAKVSPFQPICVTGPKKILPSIER